MRLRVDKVSVVPGLLAIISSVVLMAGCGGGGGTPVARTYLGTYSASGGAGELARGILTAAVASDGSVTLRTVDTQMSWIAFLGSGTVNSAGIMSATASSKNTSFTDVVTFIGTFSTQAGVNVGSGSWQTTSGGSGQWSCEENRNASMGNSGQWTLAVAGGSTRTYRYASAYGLVVHNPTAAGQPHEFLVLCFDGPSTPWPYDAIVFIPDPSQALPNIPLDTWGDMEILLSDSYDDWLLATEHDIAPATVTCSTLSTAVGGKLTGQIAGQLDTPNDAVLTLTDARFTNVSIVEELTVP